MSRWICMYSKAAGGASVAMRRVLQRGGCYRREVREKSECGELALGAIEALSGGGHWLHAAFGAACKGIASAWRQRLLRKRV